jgi:hypothetical protein
VRDRWNVDQRKGCDAVAVAKDRRKAARRLKRNGWTEDEKLAEAQAWVRSQRRAIETVARQLFEDKTLTHSDRRVIIDHADGKLAGSLDTLLRDARQSA